MSHHMLICAYVCLSVRIYTEALTREETLERMKLVRGWTLSDDETMISKELKTKNFVKALDYLNLIGKVAEAQGHHPDLHITGMNLPHNTLLPFYPTSFCSPQNTLQTFTSPTNHSFPSPTAPVPDAPDNVVSTGYQFVRIDLSTHALGGLTDNDFIMAVSIDAIPVEVSTKP